MDEKHVHNFIHVCLIYSYGGRKKVCKNEIALHYHDIIQFGRSYGVHRTPHVFRILFDLWGAYNIIFIDPIPLYLNVSQWITIFEFQTLNEQARSWKKSIRRNLDNSPKDNARVIEIRILSRKRILLILYWKRRGHTVFWIVQNWRDVRVSVHYCCLTLRKIF